MSDSLIEYVAEIRAIEDGWFDERWAENDRLGMPGGHESRWRREWSLLRRIDDKYGVQRHDPRVYSIAAYRRELYEVQAAHELWRWESEKSGRDETDEDGRIVYRQMTREEDCEARHFPGYDILDPESTVDSISKLWFHVLHEIKHISDIAKFNHITNLRIDAIAQKEIRIVHSLLLKLRVRWAPEPSDYPENRDIRFCLDQLQLYANRLEQEEMEGFPGDLQRYFANPDKNGRHDIATDRVGPDKPTLNLAHASIPVLEDVDLASVGKSFESLQALSNAHDSGPDPERKTVANPRFLAEHVALVERYEADIVREKLRLAEPIKERMEELGAKFLGSSSTADQDWWDCKAVTPEHREEAAEIEKRIKKELDAFIEANVPDIRPWDTPARLSAWISSGGYPAPCPEDKSLEFYRQARDRVLAFGKYVPGLIKDLPALADPVCGLRDILHWCENILTHISPEDTSPHTPFASIPVLDGRDMASIGDRSGSHQEKTRSDAEKGSKTITTNKVTSRRRRDGSKTRKVIELFETIAQHYVDAYNEKKPPPKIDRKQIAINLKVDKSTICRAWKKLDNTIRLKFELDHRKPIKGYKSKGGDIEADCCEDDD